jgi:hypothetical protein
MKAFAQIAYLVMGVVQFFAIWDGAIQGLGVGSFIGLIAALLLAGIPLVGSGTGVYGAVTAWDWGLLQAVILFFWYIPLMFFAFAADWWSERRLST